MINEDYVSFETAKLLKKKGFNEKCIATYNLVTGNFEVEEVYQDWTSTWKGYISAPTIQMAMKWLRNIHGLFIHIDVIREASCWLADIQDIKGDVSVYPVENEFPNYEEACEAAIKYCLENLI